MTRKATDISLVKQYCEAASIILNNVSTPDAALKLKRAEIYAKLALAAAVERLVKISLDLGEVKVDLDLIPEAKQVEA